MSTILQLLASYITWTDFKTNLQPTVQVITSTYSHASTYPAQVLRHHHLQLHLFPLHTLQPSCCQPSWRRTWRGAEALSQFQMEMTTPLKQQRLRNIYTPLFFYSYTHCVIHIHSCKLGYDVASFPVPVQHVLQSWAGHGNEARQNVNNMCHAQLQVSSMPSHQ